MILNSTELKPGDLLVLKSNKDIVHKFLKENFGTIVEKILTSVSGQKYLHVELYLGEGWVISATVNGVKLTKYPLKNIVRDFEILRPKFEVPKDELISLIKDYHNKQYDFTSLFLNIIEEITEVFNVKFEFPYNSEHRLICSELVARIYEDLGVSFKENSEFMSPQDLVDSKLFKKVT